jgi:hypothetical protein
VSFALGELGVETLDIVYDMTLAEFAIREYAYKRQQQWDWAKHRLVGFMAIRAFNINPKNIPKRVSEVIQLPFVDDGAENNGIGLSDEQMNALQKAQLKYQEELKRKKIE